MWGVDFCKRLVLKDNIACTNTHKEIHVTYPFKCRYFEICLYKIEDSVGCFSVIAVI